MGQNNTRPDPNNTNDDDLSEEEIGAEDNSLDSPTTTVDAVPPLSRMTNSLTLDEVIVVEKSLDRYEKVSVIYLLNADPVSSLEQLNKLLEGGTEKLIYNWVLHQKVQNRDWQNKLIEALTIIQNYQVLKQLGFNKDDLILRFLPHHSFTQVHLNKFRRVLYFVCENLEQIDNLLQLAYTDMEKKGFTFKPQLNYLELYFLHWESVGYIQENNIMNLCSILKQIDELDLSEKLKQLLPVDVPKMEVKKERRQSKSLIDHILDPSSSLLDLTSIETEDSCSDRYEIDSQNPGVCLVINQEKFYKERDPRFKHLLPPDNVQFEARTGTEHDKRKLVDTFEQFGFKIKTRDNLVHTDIIQTIQSVIESVTNESSLIICIMTHGDEGVIYGVNSCHVPVRYIKQLMCGKNRANLSGKPKVLILQSCQGTRCQKISIDEDDENEIVTDAPISVVPPTADLLTFWATVPGYGAIRNKRTGSWFIQSLCGKLTTLADKCHLEDICTRVIGDVSGRKWNNKVEEIAMVPLKDSTFRKLFYFPPIRKN